MQNFTKIADIQIAGLEVDSVSRGVRSALNCIRGVGMVSMQPGQRLVSVTYAKMGGEVRAPGGGNLRGYQRRVGMGWMNPPGNGS